MAGTFEALGIRTELVQGLKKMGIEEPTDIQEKAIPAALTHKDIIGRSQTGSGKTLAYLLPLFEKIDTSKREMQAIILAPTHELVMQIRSQIRLLSDNSGLAVTSAAIIGQVNIKRQIENLKEKPHIIVGSTGRILELIKLRKISAHTVKTIVIDEGDRLLDENNIEGVRAVIKTTLRDRQLMAFSATLSQYTLGVAEELMKEPSVIKVEASNKVSDTIEHMYFITEQRDKMEVLRKLVAAEQPQKAIVFINKSEETQVTTTKLQYHHLKAAGIFGSATKEERREALEAFRTGKIQLLVASDIAARGLDIEGVTHIINLDLPEYAREYLHRVGRTGRMGKPGTALSIVTWKEAASVRKFGRELGIQIHEKDIYRGAIVEPFKKKPPIKRPPQKKK